MRKYSLKIASTAEEKELCEKRNKANEEYYSALETSTPGMREEEDVAWARLEKAMENCKIKGKILTLRYSIPNR